MADREDYENGIEAMLDGNRVKFGDTVADIMQDKISDLVAARKDELAQTVFDFDAPDGDDEESSEDSEEDSE